MLIILCLKIFTFCLILVIYKLRRFQTIFHLKVKKTTTEKQKKKTNKISSLTRPLELIRFQYTAENKGTGILAFQQKLKLNFLENKTLKKMCCVTPVTFEWRKDVNTPH